MPRYYFNLKDRAGFVPDLEGTDLTDAGAARTYAAEIVRELLRHREAERRSCRLEVCDADHKPLFEVLFADLDDTLNHLSPELKANLKGVYRNAGRMNDTINDVRATLHQLKGTLARADHMPWLAAIDGRRL